jgi:ABC-type Fe3+/spermidine/putrescine transport system ATPase subunit
MSTLIIRNLSRRFGETTAVEDVSLEIQSGEFFSILGPSGCGKTTLLRMIAGFEVPTSGEIVLDGKDITRLLPQERAIGMVFQNYALFPHMTVFENVAFGLETRRVPKDRIRMRVGRILESVHLSDKIDTPVPNLSGGEQQRVAVARALVVEPAVLLFDEPLSNLDVALRVRTREEIRALQRRTQITTVYVTHDQSEAMSLSDRMAVMRAGSIEQVGTPSEMYELPRSDFVARFLGGANILKATVTDGGRKLEVSGLEVVLPEEISGLPASRVTVAIKPEAITLSPMSDGAGWKGTIEQREYLGFITHFVVACSGTILRVASMSSAVTRSMAPGSEVRVEVDWSRCTFLPGWE